MTKANALELTWIGKDSPISVESRLLIENPMLSYEKHNNSLFDEKLDGNMLIHGDNLLALQALVNKFCGKIKCIYIDPPYNTGSAFEHYDDNKEHSIWLSLMRQRLLLLQKMLTDDGFIFVQIDDNEQAYLTVLMDEIFGRKNRVNIISVKMSESSGVKMAHVEKKLPKMKEFILVYRKTDKALLNPIKVDKTDLDGYLKYYSKIIVNFNEKPENWEIVDVVSYMKQLGLKIDDESLRKFKIDNSYRMVYRTNNKSFEKMTVTSKIAEVISPTGLKYIWWEGKQMLFLSDYIKEYLCDLWNDISTINLNKEGCVDFVQSKKPEKLIERCIELSTNEGDYVMDSFLGSGTTCAVAHKMRRRWIGIEMGDHAYTHCKVRLDKVIDGEQGGISKKINWNGGGAYKFYELAPTLITNDVFGEPIINREYNPEMLASAVALHEGFNFNPNSDVFWKQSKSNENAYLYVTTTYVNIDLLKCIESQMADDEFLIIACKAFDKICLEYSKKIVIKKIPQMLLGKCEFGKDDYSLNIINPPIYEEEFDDE